MVRRIIAAVLVVVFSAAITGCGDKKVIDGVTYDTFGILSEDDAKNPEIAYKPIWGNIIWGVILIETIVAPIYFFGFSMWEPIGRKPTVKGAVPPSD